MYSRGVIAEKLIMERDLTLPMYAQEHNLNIHSLRNTIKGTQPVWRVAGDSMEPTFKDGDVIFVEPYNGDFANNRVYIIKRQDDVLVKRVKKSGDVFEVISDNKDYLPYTLSANEFQIIGRAV